MRLRAPIFLKRQILSLNEQLSLCSTDGRVLSITSRAITAVGTRGTARYRIRAGSNKASDSPEDIIVQFSCRGRMIDNYIIFVFFELR